MNLSHLETFTLLLVPLLMRWAVAEASRSERVFGQLKALRDCERRMLYDMDDNETAVCDWRFDGWQCWAPTPVGSTARAPCPGLLPGDVNSSASASYHCHWNGSWQGDMAQYATCTASHPHDPDLKLLQSIMLDIGEFVPWEQSSLRGENWQWEEKIKEFKACLEDVLLKPPPRR